MKYFVLIIALAMQGLWSLPAFPGAEGWGGEVTGGRGGRVIIVTNTNSAGAGSFYAAIRATGKRIIVFRTSGVISNDIELTPANNDFTVAGQTSPGGVNVGQPWNYGNSLNNWIIRFIRFRNPNSEHAYEAYNSDNFILDHCDFSGGCDECLDLCGCANFTVQWSTVANSPPRSAGCQNYGILIAYQRVQHVTLHHLLIANHQWRFPEMHWGNAAPPDYGKVDYRNNVLYNGTDIWFQVAQVSSEVRLNVVGNYFKAGPQMTSGGKFCNFSSQVNLYASDNTCQGGPSISSRAQAPWTMPAVTTHTSQQAYDTVLARVGAWPRDSMNTRTVREVRTGTGQFGKMDDPKITTGPSAPADADLDGMPDFWETGMGLNPNDSTDQRADKDGDGYTNIEEYINDLALARMCQDYYNPVYPIPNNWGDYNPSCCKSLAIEKRLPQNAYTGKGAAGPDAIFDISGRRVGEPRRSGVYLYRIQGKVFRRVILR